MEPDLAYTRPTSMYTEAFLSSHVCAPPRARHPKPSEAVAAPPTGLRGKVRHRANYEVVGEDYDCLEAYPEAREDEESGRKWVVPVDRSVRARGRSFALALALRSSAETLSRRPYVLIQDPNVDSERFRRLNPEAMQHELDANLRVAAGTPLSSHESSAERGQQRVR